MGPTLSIFTSFTSFQFLAKQKNAVSLFLDASGNIGATIRIAREIQCLPYAGFFNTFCPSINFAKYTYFAAINLFINQYIHKLNRLNSQIQRVQFYSLSQAGQYQLKTGDTAWPGGVQRSRGLRYSWYFLANSSQHSFGDNSMASSCLLQKALRLLCLGFRSQFMRCSIL